MSDFQDFVKISLEREGGLSDHPSDRGGFTKYGISAGFVKGKNPSWSDAQVRTYINALTIEDAKAIYYNDFYLAASCDKLPTALAFCVFDWAINAGVGRAVQHLQETVGVTADGKIGPKTLAAVRARPTLDSVAAYQARRLRWYFRKALNDPSQRDFIFGWINRNEIVTVEAVKFQRTITP